MKPEQIIRQLTELIQDRPELREQEVLFQHIRQYEEPNTYHQEYEVVKIQVASERRDGEFVCYIQLM